MREALVVIGSVLLGYNLLAGHLHERKKEKEDHKSWELYFWILCYRQNFSGITTITNYKRTAKKDLWNYKRRIYKVFSDVNSFMAVGFFPFGFDVWDFTIFTFGILFIVFYFGIFSLLGSVDYSTE